MESDDAPEGVSHLRVPGAGGRTAYPLRVQTGCDEQCAYCIVPSTRGRGRSRAVGQVVAEVRASAAAGFKEFWITGVHLGSYGRDLRPARSLLDLLAALDRAADGLDVTYRLSSLEPMDCSEDIIELVAGSSRFVPHLHLPLQHAADNILRAMRRPYDLAGFTRAADGFRHRLPDAAIGTDVIVGFPGETERDFATQVDYLETAPLTHVHVFPYSDRPGTPASMMAGKVDGGEARRRAAELRRVAARLNACFIAGQVGRERAALTLGNGTVALTDNYLKVRIPGGRTRNERVRVRIVSAEPLRGVVEGNGVRAPKAG